MTKFEVRWTENQTYYTIIEAENAEEARQKVEDGDYEECHDAGWESDKDVYDVEEIEEDPT